MSFGVSFASRGHMVWVSHVVSGWSSAIPRKSVIGRWVWQLINPGVATLPLPSIVISALILGAFVSLPT